MRAEVAVCNGRPWGAHADQCVDCNVMLTHPGVFHTCVGGNVNPGFVVTLSHH